MKGNPVGWFEIYVQDMERAKAFYEAVFKGLVAPAGGKVMREKFSIGQYGFIALVFDTEGNMFGLHSMK